MKITIPAKSINPHLVMTKAGYHAHTNGSYVMRLGRSDFPRFHAYFKKNENKLTLNLHLDQRPSVHKGVKAHAGEYDSQVVQDETARLQRWINYFTR